MLSGNHVHQSVLVSPELHQSDFSHAQLKVIFQVIHIEKSYLQIIHFLFKPSLSISFHSPVEVAHEDVSVRGPRGG
jgi:hypothetical protein